MSAAQVIGGRGCSVEGCTFKQIRVVRGLCGAHYQRAMIEGTLQRLPAKSPAERLADGLMAMPSGCIEWTGSGVVGYGRLKIHGKPVLTHRLAWELANGPILNGLYVCHKCDNRACCNVEHMFLGDASANGLDMGNKGRGWRQDHTHCPHGHEYSVENTYLKSGGRHRTCRTCARASHARWQAKQLAAGSAA